MLSWDSLLWCGEDLREIIGFDFVQRSSEKT